MQERDSQQACLDFTVTSQEGSCPVKALSKAGVLTSTHRWERERENRLFLFLGNSTDLHAITVRRHQGCKPHRVAAPAPLIFIWSLSVLGKDSRAEQK